MASITTPPNSRTQTSHAVTIHSSRNGQMIGAINEWNPTQSLGVTAVYEFGQVTGPYGSVFGAPYEKVPGNITGQTVGVRRYDIYTAQMESAFGTADLTMLSNDPGVANGGTGLMDIRERWVTPGSTNNYDDIYMGCWFSQLGRTLSATGERIINVNATLEYTHRQRIRT